MNLGHRNKTHRVLASVLAAGALLAVSTLVPAPAHAGDMVTYKIDSGHSSVGFSVTHFFSKVPGSFTIFEGSIQLDPNDLSKGSVDITIDAASIDTNVEDRDKHLRSPDFFDVQKHPKITFKSTSVKKMGPKKAQVAGKLTMHGVTKPVTLEVDVLGFGPDAWGGYRSGFQARTTINRQDFGVTWNKVLDGGGFVLGNEVDIVINIEGVRQKEETANASTSS